MSNFLFISGILLLVTSIITFLIGYFKISKLKVSLKEQEIKIREEIIKKESEIINLKRKKREILLETDTLKQNKIKEINDSLVQKTNEITANLNEMRLKQEKEIEKELQEKKQKSLELYLAQLQEEKEKITFSHQEDIAKIKEELENLKSIEGAARMARERDQKELSEKNWYMISFSKEDLEELRELSEIKLRNPLPLRKAIYDIYYREPVRALINRVVEGDRVSGIYKITLVSTGQTYIGKSVDIRRRWQEHIKRGMGAEKPTNSILYEALAEHGIENFTFEIVEVVDAAKLTSRESYWIEYFGTKTFGYNMRG